MKDGATKADHLRAAETQRGQWIDELHPEPLSDAAAGLFGLFMDLHNWRGSGGFGPQGLTVADVEGYCRITGQRLTAWELETIKILDSAAMRVSLEQQKARNG